MATGMVLIIVMRHIDLSVGSIIGFVVDDHRRRAGPLPAGLSRPRQSGDLDHRRDHRARGRRGDRRLSRLARRLSRHSRLHRHARRPIVLARRRVVGDGGPDDRAARRPLRADGRRPAWLDRSDGELDHSRRSAAPASCSVSTPAVSGGRGSASRSGRCGPNMSSQSSAASSSSARPRSSTPTPGPSGSRRPMRRPTTFPCPKADWSFPPATRFRC